MINWNRRKVYKVIELLINLLINLLIDLLINLLIVNRFDIKYKNWSIKCKNNWKKDKSTTYWFCRKLKSKATNIENRKFRRNVYNIKINKFIVVETILIQNYIFFESLNLTTKNRSKNKLLDWMQRQRKKTFFDISLNWFNCDWSKINNNY